MPHNNFQHGEGPWAVKPAIKWGGYVACLAAVLFLVWLTMNMDRGATRGYNPDAPDAAFFERHTLRERENMPKTAHTVPTHCIPWPEATGGCIMVTQEEWARYQAQQFWNPSTKEKP